MHVAAMNIMGRSYVIVFTMCKGSREWLRLCVYGDYAPIGFLTALTSDQYDHNYPNNAWTKPYYAIFYTFEFSTRNLNNDQKRTTIVLEIKFQPN